MQRFRVTVETFKRSEPHQVVTVAPGMEPDGAGEWVRFADVPVPPDALLEEVRRDRDAATNGLVAAQGRAARTEAERDRLQALRDDLVPSLAAANADCHRLRHERDQAVAERDTWRQHYESLARMHAARGRDQTAAEHERDAALKLVEERSLAAGRAEEALRVDSSFRDTWRVERERRLIVDAELADQRRVYGEACAEIKALREERDGLRMSLKVKLGSNIEASTIDLLRLAASIGETDLVRELLRAALGRPAPPTREG